jgi:molecular chaperone DnaK
LIFTAEKSLKDAAEKITEELRKEVEEKISALKSILDSGSKDDLEIKTKELSESLQKIGEAMYKKDESGEKPAEETKAEDSTANGQEKTENKKSDEEPVEGEVVN